MDLDELYRVLRGAHVQAQGIDDTIREPLLVLDADLKVSSANPAFFEKFAVSRDETLGRPFLELGNGQWDIPELRLLLERVLPKSATVLNYEVEAVFPGVGKKTMLVTAQRLSHPDHARQLILISLSDATEQRAADFQKNLLIGEIRHRLKNLLAVTAAMARQTRTEGLTAEQFRDAFLGRFGVMARALEASLKDEPARLPELVASVMEPFLAGTRLELEDVPNVNLSPQQAMPLGMILHELATNALKYGALSVESGWVNVSWSLAQDDPRGPRLAMKWAEAGGPVTLPPSSIGFGTHLVKSAAERDLHGMILHRYEPQGLVVLLDFPLAERPEGHADGS